MDLPSLVEFLRGQRLAVLSTVTAAGQPQAALIGVAFAQDIGFVFDTSATSRKLANLRANPRAALVIGWEEETTVQIEGLAHEPLGAALARAKAVYFAAFPDGRGRETWPDIAYRVITPAWARYSNYLSGPTIAEFDWPR